MTIEKYVCEPRKCIACPTEIHVRGETLEEKKARGIYHEITIELSNGSQMRVGVCNVCKDKDLDQPAMLEAIKERWRATIRPARKELLESQIKYLKIKDLINA